MILLLISSISLYKTVQGHIFDGILFPSRLCSFSFNFALLNACSSFPYSLRSSWICHSALSYFLPVFL